MPGKIQINTSPTSMGFSVTADDTALIGNNSAKVEVQAVLDQFVALQLCTYSTTAANAASWTNGGTKFLVNTANKQMAKGLSVAIQLMDNTSKMV